MNLPTEVQISIANSCSTGDSKRLCETCHLLRPDLHVARTQSLFRLQSTYTSQLPELYRTVDLSSHNVDEICIPLGRDAREEEVSPTFCERHWDDSDKHAFAKQKQLIEAVQHGNNYAKHVRRIHWTVIDTSGQFWGAPVDEHLDGDSDEVKDDLPLYMLEDGT
jgi:hypothetical protein